MTERGLASPVFVIGMPRSGTTVLFDALARHHDLGWVSNYCRMYPRAPWVNVCRRLLDNPLVHLYGHKKQYGSAPRYNLWLPQPDEAYEFWDAYAGVPFSRTTLHDRLCDPADRAALREAASRVMLWQGRNRFAAKLTGPPRIRFLNSVFPDAHFVHLVRDGRAVVHSLLGIPFWRKKGGLDRPFWPDLLGPEDLQSWERGARDPALLAALQWKRVIELARTERSAIGRDQYIEVRYEDFTATPHDVVSEVLRVCGLAESSEVHRAIDAGPRIRNMNDKFAANFSADSLNTLTAVMQPLLQQLGYGKASILQADG